MSAKQMKKLRKLLNLNLGRNNDLEETKFRIHGTKRVGIIDGVNGNHKIEERDNLLLTCDEDKRLYRKLKKELKNKDSLIREQLLTDLSQL